MHSKIIAGLLLYASCAFAGEFDKFVADNGVAYAYCEAHTNALQTLIPTNAVGALDITPAVYEIGTSNLISAAVTNRVELRDYALTIRYGNSTNCIVRLAYKQSAYGRLTPSTPEQLATWDAFMTPAGYPSSMWLDLAGYQALLTTPEYAIKEED